MPGKTSGFAALVKTEVLHVTVTPCSVHQCALLCKTLPWILRESLATVVKVFYDFVRAKSWITDCARGFVTKKSTVVRVAKFRKAKTFNRGLLKRFCQEVGATRKFTCFRKTNSIARILPA